MGTLTANSARLPEYCEHKLPTSCRLSSIPQCCACADERPHAAEYRTYIDGIGFVPRGTRWQRYCWFCKEFWANRVELSGLRPPQTRVPEVPDQREFLARWYEFWQGYRITGQNADGTETRQAVLGEELKEVSPGFLPRTLEELRAGRERSEADRRNAQQELGTQESSDGPSLESALDALLDEAHAEDDSNSQSMRQPVAMVGVPTSLPDTVLSRLPISHPDTSNHTNTRSGEYQARRIAALRRELHRMRAGIERVISGLRDLGEDIPDHHETTSLLDDLSNNLESPSGGIVTQDQATRAISSINSLAAQNTIMQQDRGLSSLQTRVEEARQQFNLARQARDQAASALERTEQDFRVSQERLRNLQRDYRTAENYMRVFGSREQLIEDGESYESPIGGMFTRAFERYRAAEQVRQEEQTLRQVLQAESAAGGEENTRRLEEIGRLERDIWGVPRPRGAHPRGASSEPVGQTNHSGPEELTRNNEVVQERGRRRHYTRSEDQIESDLREDATLILDVFHETASQTTREALMLLNPDWSRERVIEIGTRVANGEADQMERLLFGSEVLRNEDVIFIAKVPEARISRAYRRGFYQFRERGQADELRIWNTEMMAQAYMSSSTVRTKVEVSPPERLQILYRLQAGRRERHDRALLVQLLEDTDAKSIAERFFANPRESSLAEVIDEFRRQEARDGNHSRQELEERRRAARAFAIAAGRVAMNSSSLNVTARRNIIDEEEAQHLLDESATFSEEAMTTPLLQNSTRTRLSNMETLSMSNPRTALHANEPSSSDNEADEQNSRSPSPGPLDAKDTGRPEAKSDEEMTLKLDCKICYSQTADIACLPCGHLVMCQWCSEQHSPVMGHDRTRPRRAAGCPVCRKGIRQKVRVFRA